MGMCTLQKILCLNLILISPYLFRVVFSQRIQLFPYNETKKCTTNIVNKRDRIVMYGKVDLNGNIKTPFDVYFEIKRKSDLSFVVLCFLKVPQDCDKYSENYCSCHKTNDPKVFQVLGNITAYKNNSEADIRAELVYRDTSFYSEIRQLPIVYGSQTDLIVVYANDQVVHVQQTDVSINHTQVTIVSTCREKFAQDCKLQLINLENGVLLKSGKEIVIYNTNIKGRSNLNLKYSICTIERNISFLITTTKTTEHLHLTTERNPVVIILSTINILTIAMVICCFFYVRPKKFRRMIQRLNCRSKYIYNDNKVILRKHLRRDESQSLMHETTTDWNPESNEKFEEENTKNTDEQQKKRASTTCVPIRYRNKDFKELLEVLSQLTCRINVKEEVGCGLVTGVVRYFNGVGINTVKPFQSQKCPCPKCLKSKSTSNTWAEIFITTSSAILKNKNYHKQITCVLSTADNVTTELRGLSVEHKDSEKSGRCLLKYVTCDVALVNKLQVLQEERARLEEKVQEIFHRFKENDKVYVAIVYGENYTKYNHTGEWSIKKIKHNVRTYRCDPVIPFGNIGAPLILLGYTNVDYEYKHTKNSQGEVILDNVSTSAITIESAQNVKETAKKVKTD